MGKNTKPYIIISGLAVDDNNRGTAALGYGAISFLKEKGELEDVRDICSISFDYQFRHVFSPKVDVSQITSEDKCFTIHHYTLSVVEQQIVKHAHWLIPLTRIGWLVKGARCVAAINGGDGFSDIYSARTFFSRLAESISAIKMRTRLIILPQTLGPFKEQASFRLGMYILKHATKVFIRDDKFTDELKKQYIAYELTNDLSAYMLPEAFDIDIRPMSVGLNISGLAYSNNYGPLAGHFAAYPKFINRLIVAFQELGTNVYLIPHSYNYVHTETNNDDLAACRQAYDALSSKEKITVIDVDLPSPRVKYVISRMSFFIGTRMHANFAAIFTKVPLVGLSYSYKFEGAFHTNGIPSEQLVSVVDMSEQNIPANVEKIIKIYNKIRK